MNFKKLKQMMILKFVLLLIPLFLFGCASPPQQPIPFSIESVSSKAGRIGVVMTGMPKLDTQVPGAGCLLCLAFAIGSNSTLTAHAQTLTYEDLTKLKDAAAGELRKQGANVFVIDDQLNIDDLPDFNSSGPNTSKKDFSSLQKKYQLDKLVVISIVELGFERKYSAYIPVSDPKGLFRGAGFLVNFPNHSYEWYQPVYVTKSAEQNWDEPPKFPGLTNAYYQALEIGKDSLLRPILDSKANLKSAGVASQVGGVGSSQISTVKIPASTSLSTGEASAIKSLSEPKVVVSPSQTVSSIVAPAKVVKAEDQTSKSGPKAGDEWEYLAVDNLYGKQKKLLWRVQKVDSSGVMEELQMEGKPNTQFLFDSKADLVGVPIDSGFFFGSQWNGQDIPTLQVRGNGDCVTRNQCEVKLKKAAYERITVPAGTFEAVRYEGSISAVSTGVRYTIGRISIWYSESERRLLKQSAQFRSSVLGMQADETVTFQRVKRAR